MINNKLKKFFNILVMNEKTNISAVNKNSISYLNKSHRLTQISFAVCYTQSQNFFSRSSCILDLHIPIIIII